MSSAGIRYVATPTEMLMYNEAEENRNPDNINLGNLDKRSLLNFDKKEWKQSRTPDI